MPQKKHKPAEIDETALRSTFGVARSLGWRSGPRDRCDSVTYYRWRKAFGGLKGDQVKRLKELEKVEPLSTIGASPMARARLRKAVSDLTLDKLILSEAARGNF